LAEHWQQPVGRGEWNVQQFQLAGSVQRFLFAPCAVSTTFSTQRPLLCRRTLRVFGAAAQEQWRAVAKGCLRSPIRLSLLPQPTLWQRLKNLV